MLRNKLKGFQMLLYYLAFKKCEGLRYELRVEMNLNFFLSQNQMQIAFC